MRHPLLVLNLGVSPSWKYVRALAGGWLSLWALRFRGRMICQLYTGVYLRGVFRLGSGIAMIQGKARQAALPTPPSGRSCKSCAAIGNHR
jgi:hypothetical protein